MKKLLLIVVGCSSIWACNNATNANVQIEPPVVVSATEIDSYKGKELINKSDCKSCHQDHSKLIGPAYVDVAKKYESTKENIDKLVDKIIKGGQGEWGQIPMSPHANLAKEDVEEMVKYILTIKAD